MAARPAGCCSGLTVAEGLLDRVALTATGDPEEPGVQIAAELADRVGRPLLLETRTLEDASEFEQQARIHAFQTGGVGSLWDLAGRLGIVRSAAYRTGCRRSGGAQCPQPRIADRSTIR